jgi:hypothetical protein
MLHADRRDVFSRTFLHNREFGFLRGPPKSALGPLLQGVETLAANQADSASQLQRRDAASAEVSANCGLFVLISGTALET